MPPRIPSSLQACAELASSAKAAAVASPLEHALLSSRAFSTSTARQRRLPTHPKSQYLKWLKGEGKELEYHVPGQTNYIKPFSGFERSTRKPFPYNPTFTSQPVLSEDARELIYQRVFTRGEPIKVVSADLGVDHRRVAAVVRMKEIEKDWERQVRFAAHTLEPQSPPTPSLFLLHDDSKQKFD